MKKYLNLLAITAGASLVGAVAAQAQLVAYDGIDYPTGLPGSVVGNNGGSGDWNGAWSDKGNYSMVVGGMSYSTLPTVGNSIYGQGQGSANYGSSTEAERVLNNTFGFYANANSYEANTLWMSFLWNGQPEPSLYTGAGLYRQASMMFLAGGTPSAGSGSEMLDIGMPNINSGNQATVAPNVSLWVSHDNIDSSAPGSSSPIQSGVAANVNAADFILVQMTSPNAWVSGTAQTINVWVNPTLTGATPVGAPDMTYSGQDYSGINALRIQSGGYNSNDGGIGQQQADEIRIGWTANAVETMSTANVVPEPTTLAFMGFGALGLLFFKRKR